VKYGVKRGISDFKSTAEKELVVSSRNQYGLLQTEVVFMHLIEKIVLITIYLLIKH
jgi:hypothetical protein